MKKAVLAILAFSTVAWGASSSIPSRALPDVRRIITSEDATGRAYVLADGPSANVVTLNGSKITRLWETDGSPVAIPVSKDLGATAGNAYRPGFAGSSLYVADIPPASNLSNIPLHRQESMDYIIVASGEIDLVLPGPKRLRMRAGDVLIQAGNEHSWINPTDKPARLLCITQTGARRG